MMTKNLNPISIVCVCDNHYIVLLGALIKSIEVNNSDNRSLEFYIVEEGITKANKKKLVDSVDEKQVRITWLPISTCIPKDIKLPADINSLPTNIYARLFISEFLPSNIDQVIYLDVDMIVLSPISKLWDINLGHKIVAAVQDQFIQTVSRWGGVPNYEHFGIAPEQKYFNSGLMLINLPKWRAANVSDRVISCIHENKEFSQFADQYGLNVVLHANWLELDPLWNCFAYSEHKNPYLIHFTGRKPIYKSYNFSEEYRNHFYNYLKQTEWNNFKPINETRRYVKKIMNVVHKFLSI